MFSGQRHLTKTYQAGMLKCFNNGKNVWKCKKFNSPIFKLVSQKLRICNICSTTKEFNNSNISDWNTSSVTDIRSMFRGATSLIKI
nr:BspA family leucine-rich repeat surface protein [Mycoplasmopsis bovis]